MGFKEDLQLSIKAQRVQNKIYDKLFDIKNIKRFDFEDKNILDVKYHIDVELELRNGIKLLGQEKALRNKFIRYNCFTIEFYQDRFKKIKGEFFNLGAQFYLHSYYNQNEDDFENWYFIKIFDFLEWLKGVGIERLEKNTKASTSKASFFYIDYNKIPKQFIYNKNT